VEGTGICLDTSDWRHLISALERVGYEGVFMLEVAGDGEVPDHVARAWASAGRLLPAR
jgi:sugar phosphate isomerase/epimerase